MLDLAISFLEIVSLLCLLLDFFNGRRAPGNQFLVVIFFTIFFLCMLTERGMFSRIVSRTPFCRLGKYAYSIYVMQIIAFYILRKTFWRNTAFLSSHPAASLLISVAAAVLLGILTYYLVEKPAGKLSKWIVRD